MQVGIPQTSTGIGRFGVSGPPNAISPSGSNPVMNNPDTPWYASGPFWVIVFLVVGYILVFQTLR